MTVYNGERYLADAIDSIRQQSLRNFDFVIVDDGSEDRTSEILTGCKADPRIKVISQPRIGRARALNVAWTHAQGAYIANLDADDVAEPNRLEKQLTFLQQHPEVGLAGTACKVLDEYTGKTRIKCPLLTDLELRRALVRKNQFVHTTVMIPRHVLEEVGGYNESFRVAVDYELWVRIACRYQLANLPDVLTVKRRHRRAYFHHKFPFWERHKTHAAIRWNAWRRLSRHPAGLYFVLDPIGLVRGFVKVKFPR
jgi:glycosyltransferase involved in cell wall biosynthesis